jgi:FlgD Ig-like domain
MKIVSIILSCCLLAILLLSASAALGGNYVNLVVNTEKWYETAEWSDKCPQRMHTLVYPYPGGLFRMHREILQEQRAISSEDRIYSHNPEGDIFYHGELSEPLFDDPILWIDAPLTVGKTWQDSRPETVGPGKSEKVVYYVFAVLDKTQITCPAGNFECYRVLLSRVYPNGEVKNCHFWFNAECGLILCDTHENPMFKLAKAFVNDSDPIDYDIQNPPLEEDAVLGGVLGVPNPANPMTSISFELNTAAQVDVEVFDISGQLVKRLVQDEFMTAGPVSLRWQGTDDQGRAVASGTYLFRVRAGQTVSTNRITLVR